MTDSVIWARRVFTLVLMVWSGTVTKASGTAQFITIQSGLWHPIASTNPTETVFQTPSISTPFPWTELIASWNATTNAALEIEASIGSNESPWLSLGAWAADTNAFPRTSRPSPRGALDRVDTDTLVLKKPSENVRFRLRWRRGTPAMDLKFFGFVVWSAGVPSTSPKPVNQNLPTPVPSLDVPLRSQADYPEGINQWCSPTSVTMVLASLDPVFAGLSVRTVANGVFDPGWPGTGNWSFNMAYAGSFPGIRARVSRFESMDDLQAWLHLRHPVVCSVSYSLLNGKLRPTRGDGHLVVAVGIEPSGDVIIHDPGRRIDRVRRRIPRLDFEKAWEYSRRTVYLVHRESDPVPDFNR